MTTEPRAIAADFVTFRHVQGRKVLQLVVETPVEDMEKIFKVLGTPKSGESLWVAIAPMPAQQDKSVGYSKDLADRIPGSLNPAPAETSERSEAAHSPRKFSELPLVRQVGIRCSDVLFQDYLGCETELEVIDIVRAKCAVSSRKDIIEGSPAGAIWHQIERQYQSWLTDRKFAEAKR